jgi:hypothetical protein
MPSQRRIKVLGLTVLVIVLTIIYFTSAARETRESDFYKKTSTALQQKEETARVEKETADAARLSEDVGKRLREAEEQAKKSADAKGRKMAQEVMGKGLEPEALKDDTAADGGKSVAGRFRMKDDSDEPLGVAKVGGNVGEKDRKGKGKQDDEETDEDHEVEVELNAILKKSPSMCSAFLTSCANFILDAQTNRISLMQSSSFPRHIALIPAKRNISSWRNTTLRRHRTLSSWTFIHLARLCKPP